MIKTRTWIIIICIILGISLISCAFLLRGRNTATEANIYMDGRCIYSVDLSTVKNPYENTIYQPDGGYNTVLIEPGRICIKDADCADKVCVDTGFISNTSFPIVCLPHRLVIRIESVGKEPPGTFDSVAK